MKPAGKALGMIFKPAEKKRAMMMRALEAEESHYGHHLLEGVDGGECLVLRPASTKDKGDGEGQFMLSWRVPSENGDAIISRLFRCRRT